MVEAHGLLVAAASPVKQRPRQGTCFGTISSMSQGLCYKPNLLPLTFKMGKSWLRLMELCGE